jgi:hypothetical protein
MLACLLITYSPIAGVSYSVCRMLSKSFNNTIVMQIITCHSHIRQKSVLLVTDQSRSRHTAHVVFSAAQPGRNWLCRCEALLLLARLYRIKGMQKAGLHCCIHQGSIAVKIVIVQRQEERGKLSLCLYLS